jgi:hypothetical protein
VNWYQTTKFAFPAMKTSIPEGHAGMDCILEKILVTIAMVDAGILLDQSSEEVPRLLASVGG